ncbi:sodium-coupled monocarboxylate transporter 1-like [Amblyomma americanum]
MAQVVDYAVFSLLTGASLGVGLYFSIRRKKAASGQTTDELFLGSKSLQTLPLAASVLATVGSATGVVGMPAHMYAYGLHLGWLCLSNVILIPFAVSVVVPVLYRLNITSVFQYVRMRYNTVISVIAAITYIMLSQMVGGIAIYASSVAVSTVFNVSATWCSVAVGLTATGYTAVGGLRSVVWADCLQGLLALSVPVLITAKVAYDAEDTGARPFSELEPRKYFLNTAFDLTRDETLWAVFIATSPTFFNRICLDQGTAQRYLASRTLREAKWTVITGTLLACVFYGLAAFAGAALACRYRGCDPILAGTIQRFDQLLPFYVAQDFPGFPGLSGVFLAGVVSASVSTVSSMVNSQAAVWYFDVVTPFFTVAGAHVDCTIKTLGFAVGGVMTACSVLIPYLGSVMSMFMAVNAAITGPFVGLLVLGLTVPFANSKGAGVVTLLMAAYQLVHMFVRINAGVEEDRMPVSLDYCTQNTSVAAGNRNATFSTHTERSVEVFPLFRLSSHWNSFLSTCATYFGGLAVSHLLGGNELPGGGKQNLTSDLLWPLWRKLGWTPSNQKQCRYEVPKRSHRANVIPCDEQAGLRKETYV